MPGSVRYSVWSVYLALFLSSMPCVAAEEEPATEAAFGADCEKLLLGEINKSRERVLVAIYSFTRQSIRDALVNAVKRGVDVHVKYDAESAKWVGMRSLISYMNKRGVRCTAITLPQTKKSHPKMHHKFVVIDKTRVITGSFNYSHTAATKNYENLVLISDSKIAAKFTREFDAIKSKGRK